MASGSIGSMNCVKAEKVLLIRVCTEHLEKASVDK